MKFEIIGTFLLITPLWGLAMKENEQTDLKPPENFEKIVTARIEQEDKPTAPRQVKYRRECYTKKDNAKNVFNKKNSSDKKRK